MPEPPLRRTAAARRACILSVRASCLAAQRALVCVRLQDASSEESERIEVDMLLLLVSTFMLESEELDQTLARCGSKASSSVEQLVSAVVSPQYLSCRMISMFTSF